MPGGQQRQPARRRQRQVSDHDALLAAILAAPQDDLPRLVMADWHEERGEWERAEFIRYQVGNPDGCCDGPAGHGSGMASSLPMGSMVIWRRGFLAEISCMLHTWLMRGPLLVREHPVEHVTLTDRAPIYDLRTGLAKWWIVMDEVQVPWHDSDIPKPSHILPHFFKHIKSTVKVTFDGSRNPYDRHHDTVEHAHDALSVAALAWARKITALRWSINTQALLYQQDEVAT